MEMARFTHRRIAALFSHAMNVKAATGTHNLYYKAKSPSGDVHVIWNFTEFARVHGLNKDSIARVVNGAMVSHRGWTRP